MLVLHELIEFNEYLERKAAGQELEFDTRHIQKEIESLVWNEEDNEFGPKYIIGSDCGAHSPLALEIVDYFNASEFLEAIDNHEEAVYIPMRLTAFHRDKAHSISPFYEVKNQISLRILKRIERHPLLDLNDSTNEKALKRKIANWIGDDYTTPCGLSYRLKNWVTERG